jgi:hypothetical protein
MSIVRVDPHAHLYDQFSLERFCSAAIANLGITPSTSGVVVLVDREGQDSFARLRGELGSNYAEIKTSEGHRDVCVARVVFKEGLPLYLLPGVQYVSAERLEVLALGIGRSLPDGAPCTELIQRIRDEGGVVCLPWSPGKWLGRRGRIIATLLSELSPSDVVFGDISLHARGMPPSLLARRARARGFSVLPGTEPLPRPQDDGLVGSYGFQFDCQEALSLETVRGIVLGSIVNNINALQPWGSPSSFPVAVRRFISTL